MQGVIDIRTRSAFYVTPHHRFRGNYGALLGLALVLLTFAGWYEHLYTCFLYTCFNEGVWSFLIMGAVVSPIGISTVGLNGWLEWRPQPVSATLIFEREVEVRCDGVLVYGRGPAKLSRQRDNMIACLCRGKKSANSSRVIQAGFGTTLITPCAVEPARHSGAIRNYFRLAASDVSLARCHPCEERWLTRR